jgi:hypothetical protein
MIIQTQDYRGREAPQFIAGSSHLFYFNRF